MLKYLFLVFLSLNAHAITYNFEDLPLGGFRKIYLLGATIEVASFDDVAFIGAEDGRPQHFGLQSLYTDNAITVTFEPHVNGVAVSAAPFKKGKGSLQCWLWDTVTNQPYPYPMNDTTAVDMIYPHFDNMSNLPPRRYKVHKCVIKGISEGVWIDALVTQ